MYVILFVHFSFKVLYQQCVDWLLENYNPTLPKDIHTNSNLSFQIFFLFYQYHHHHIIGVLVLRTSKNKNKENGKKIKKKQREERNKTSKKKQLLQVPVFQY